jgi:NAD(P)H-dependent FMN reductase
VKATIDRAVKNLWWKKVLWLLLIWSGSVLALAVAAYVLRQIMRAVGLTA